jgi:predicted RNA-binding protein YlqC (UPF0109 family)
VNVDDNTTAGARDESLENGLVNGADGFEDYEDVELGQDGDDLGGGDFEDAISAASASGDEPADQLRNLVVWIVDQLVDEPENVTVDAVKRGSAVQVQVRLPEADLGKVIGRGGRIAKSMRTALMIVGSRHHLRVSLDIEGQA